VELVRLNKHLKELNICSRRKADEFIVKGYVKVNGQVITELGFKLNPSVDQVEITKELIAEKQQFRYLVLNKPRGYVCSKNKAEGKLIFDLLPPIANLTYAGRLDKDSHGLVIVSSDGQFVYKAFASEFNKEKEYIVRVNKPITREFLTRQADGSIILDGKQLRKAQVSLIDSFRYRIILTEGINRQLRRMAEVCGYNVIDLKRIRIGKISDKGLKAGDYRDLHDFEIKHILAK
jgi:pseudouridine synthase